MDYEKAGISRDALWRYIEEQIFALPGLDAPGEVLTVLLTGSRAAGVHQPQSDVDIDVVCPQAVYESVHRAALETGVIDTPRSFFVTVPEVDWERYFGRERGRPHFSVTSLRQVERHFREYHDVWLWIWTNAQVITDPNGQFERIRGQFKGYPQEVLVGKIKYRWLLASYWAIEQYPHNHGARDELLLAAATGLLSSIQEYLRVFFLVEGKPFPYAERLMTFAEETKLGREFVPLFQRAIDLILGRTDEQKDLWQRLDSAFELLMCEDLSDESKRLCGACAEMMIDAGVEPDWVQADFNNIDELLLGELGPIPS